MFGLSYTSFWVCFSSDFLIFVKSRLGCRGLERLSAPCVRSARAGTATIPISLVISAHNDPSSKNSRPMEEMKIPLV